MSIKPIIIDIKNNQRFGEVAFLVDREDFLTDVQKARKELGIKTSVPYEGVTVWKNSEFQEESGELPNIDNTVRHRLIPGTKSDTIVENLARKYHKTFSFYYIIEYAIICGKVADKEFIPAVCRLIYPIDYHMDYLGGVSEPDLAIFITSDTKIEDIEKLFETEVPAKVAEYRKYILGSDRIAPDTISNIKRDRDWYWKKQDGLTYQEIWEQTPLKDRPATREAVIQAIRQYKLRLTAKV